MKEYRCLESFTINGVFYEAGNVYQLSEETIKMILSHCIAPSEKSLLLKAESESTDSSVSDKLEETTSEKSEETASKKGK